MDAKMLPSPFKKTFAICQGSFRVSQMFEDIPEYNVIKGRSAKIHLAFFNVSHGHFRNTVRNLRRRRVDFHAVKLCIGITVLYPEQIRPAVTSDLKNTDGGIFEDL